MIRYTSFLQSIIYHTQKSIKFSLICSLKFETKLQFLVGVFSVNAFSFFYSFHVLMRIFMNLIEWKSNSREFQSTHFVSFLASVYMKIILNLFAYVPKQPYVGLKNNSPRLLFLVTKFLISFITSVLECKTI